MSPPDRDRWEEYREQVIAGLAATQFARIYAEIRGAKPSGNGHMLGCCPFHDDQHPSFGFSTDTGVWSCFAGCGQGSVFDFEARRSNRPFKDVLLSLGDDLGLPRPSSNGDGHAIYDYRDESGALLFQVVRGAGKRFSQRKPDGQGGYIHNLIGVRRVLYQLPELLARPADTVFIVEGEKDVESLRSVGRLATTNPGGAGKWRDEYNTLLRGRDVVILPDNDAAGKAHAEKVGNVLAEVATTVKVVELPGLPDKGDVSDWLAAGHTLAELDDLVTLAPAWQRPAVASGIAAVMEGQTDPLRGRRTVLVPGGHVGPDGVYHEISEGRFARDVLDAIPEGWLYRRGEPPVPGELIGPPGGRYFSVLEPDAARVLIGDHARLCRAPKNNSSGKRSWAVCPVTRSHAALVLAEAKVNDHVRNLQLIVPYPASGCRPGWNDNGIYYDEAPELQAIEPELDSETIHCALDDLLVDFPFKDEASRQNAIGLMLTLLLRPVIEGNVPLHLVLSPLERTGKTKLCEEVFGGTLLGYPTPALQLTGSEEEIDKRLVGLLLKAKPVVHLDNLRAYVDSPALASLITASRYQGRMLGSNAMPELGNQIVLVASGNNVRMSGEMAKRSVPILLQPTDDSPELRGDFHHADLRTFVRESRRLNLACLLGMIARWEQQGRPEGKQRLGGFEAWAAIVGGVMEVNHFDQWLQNAREWQRQADPHGEDLASFVELWRGKYGTALASANDLLELALDHDLFLEEIRSSSEKGRLNSFCKRVLGRHKDTPVAGWVVRQQRTNAARLWQLLPVGGEE